MVIVAPRTDTIFALPKHKKKIHVRPKQASKIADYMIDLGIHKWAEVFKNVDPHGKANRYHDTIITTLNKHIKENS